MLAVTKGVGAGCEEEGLVLAVRKESWYWL